MSKYGKKLFTTNNLIYQGSTRGINVTWAVCQLRYTIQGHCKLKLDKKKFDRTPAH